MKNKYTIIHGHFYQPPRENPWTGQIELQDSAYPFHDWNERIAAECYTPNTCSRVLNEENLINEIVNNYIYFSFNFGPTLIQWIEQHIPQTYKKILEADKKSIELNNGHGNAIAQVYNHVIMPLASDDDKRTQIEWGIQDFTQRFNRFPESMWLAETAIDTKTVTLLIEYGIKFIILSPHQAEKIRAFNSMSWINVNTGLIDTRVPYRIFHTGKNGKIDRKKYLDVFFYNAPLSSAVGFEHLLTDAFSFAERIQHSFDSWSPAGQAVIIATDGESYGHHEKHADMCFAAFCAREVENRDFSITNFGNFLEMFPPQFEVVLKSGPNNEGTAWSCAHGVGRWYRDCGCSTGGLHNWNQKWRTPLRESFDYLRKKVNEIYEKNLNKHVRDLKKLRNDYIDIIINPKNKNSFIKKHIKPNDSSFNRSTLFKLLEAQHFAQLMYTSCAWFFADVSGIEPVQNIKYAAKLIEILKEFTKNNIEDEFLKILDNAKSNIPEQGTGKDCYERYVKPSIYQPEMIIGNYAIETFILNEVSDRKIFHYNLHTVLYEQKHDGSSPVYKGIVKITNEKTDFIDNYIYYLFVPSYKNIHCYILNSDENLEFNISPVNTIENKIASLTHSKFYDLKDLIGYNRENLIQLALKEEMNRLKRVFNDIYKKNIDLLSSLKQYDLDLPNVLKEVCSFALTEKITKEINRLKKIKSDKKVYQDYEKVRDIYLSGKKLGLKINPSLIEKDFNDIIVAKLLNLQKKLDYSLANTALEFINLGNEMGLTLDTPLVQNLIYHLLKDDLLNLKTEGSLKNSLMAIRTVLTIAKKLSFNIKKLTHASGIDFNSI